MVFIIYAVIFKIYALACERYIAQENYMLMQHHVELRDEQYYRIQENTENSRKLRHNLKHHMITLNSFLRNGGAEFTHDNLEFHSRVISDRHNRPQSNAHENSRIKYT